MSNANSPISVLIVDDEPNFALGITRLLAAEFSELDIVTAANCEEALAITDARPIALLLISLQVPGMERLRLQDQILRRRPHTKVIIITVSDTIEKAVAAVHRGAFDILTKPVSPEQLYRAVGKAVDFIRLEQENIRLRELLTENSKVNMLGESGVMALTRRRLAAVAAADYPVLIFGDSGTGKRLAAKLVHQLSSRSAYPFISINCPAIAENLLERELFCYVKGAFTGADENKRGLVASTERGTLHLDEIGALSPAMQTKLLHFCQDGEIRPMEATATRNCGVRIIASSNVDLKKMVREGSFRADLFDRLNIISVHMPPLSERREDIGLLATYFMNRIVAEMGLRPLKMKPEVISYLEAREWPGNVRELENYIGRLVVFSTNEELSLKVVRLVEGSDAELHSYRLGPYKETKRIIADRFSRNYLQRLLKQTSGNVSEASRISGLSRMAIQKLGQRLAIDFTRFR